MQTFLPYSDFDRTARVLDLPRLGKQRVETLQILRALTFDDYGWRNHPAVLMWRGYTPALVTYGAAVSRRWKAAGFADTVLPQLLEFLDGAPLRSQRDLRRDGALPPWLGTRALHRSHQAALVRKDPAHYRPHFPTVDDSLDYVWPEPAPAAADQGPVSGWVIRVPDETVAIVRDTGLVGVAPAGDESSALPLGTSVRKAKRRRQVAAFVEEMDTGDVVVVPDGEDLLVGQVTGGYAWRDDVPGGLCHTRPVRWMGSIPRSDLERPVHLQDPRVIFALRGEPALEQQWRRGR